MDKEINLRLAAVARLADVGDRTDLPLLSRLAESDPHRNVNHGKESYPVREAARQAIAAISSR
jgi:hypothetical protein